MPTHDLGGTGQRVRDRASTATFTAQRAVEVTPSDTVDLDEPCRALFIGADEEGPVDVAIIPVAQTTSLVLSCTPGTVLPIATRRVLSTGTEAAQVVALY